MASASEKINDGFKTLSNSLQQLQSQTEQIETEMKAAKRPRVERPVQPDASMEDFAEPSNKSGEPPFTSAG